MTVAAGHQDKLDPLTTRGAQLGDVQHLLSERQLPSSSYLRTAAVLRTHGNRVRFRFFFKRVTGALKVNVVICEGDSDPSGSIDRSTGKGTADSTVVGGVQTLLDTGAARLKKNAFTIDEPTQDDQGNADGFYPFDVVAATPYVWAAVYANAVTAAGDTIKVDAYEILSQ